MGSTEESSKKGSNCPDETEEDEELLSKKKLQQRDTLKLEAHAKSGSDSGNYSSDNNSTSTDSSSNGSSKATGTTAVAATGSRPRHDSNSSADSTRSPSTDRMKRRRTTSLSSSPLSSFFFPSSMTQTPASATRSTSSLFTTPTNKQATSAVAGAGASNPSLMSLDDVMSAVNGVTNMALAHEIALDSNFKLEKFEPPQASLEKKVRDVMHQAFWDNLRDQLSQEPPVYTQAFVLLQEVRDQLLEITLPHQRKLRQEIKDKLDFDLIKQQAEHGVLDFAGYSGYVVELMAKLCAPVRDEAIQRLREQSDVVCVFSGVAETLDLMKLDMANYTIQMIRPTIMKQIVEYERTKFKEFLKTQNDGLELTRNWLVKHVDSTIRAQNSAKSQATPTSVTSANSGPSTSLAPPPSTVVSVTSGASSSLAPPTAGLEAGLAPPIGLLGDPLALRAFCNNALNSAYMDLLQWPQEMMLPESVCVDSERVLEQRDRLHQVCLLSAVLLVSLSTINQQRPSLGSSQDQLKALLKKDLCPILDPAYTQSETLAALPNLLEQVISSLQGYLKDHSLAPLDAPTLASLRHQLKDLQQPSHRITALVTSRCVAFLSAILGGSASPKNVTIPGPFVILQEEVARICGAFLRFTQHNRAVFGEHYYSIVEDRLRYLTDTYYSNSYGGSSNAPTGSGDGSTGGGDDCSTGGGDAPSDDASTGGDDTSTGGGSAPTGGGNAPTGGDDCSTGGGDGSTGGGDGSTGGGDGSTVGGDGSTGGGSAPAGHSGVGSTSSNADDTSTDVNKKKTQASLHETDMNVCNSVEASSVSSGDTANKADDGKDEATEESSVVEEEDIKAATWDSLDLD